MKNENKDYKCLDLKLWGLVTVWPKWQIVIPKEVRDTLSIHPWDSIMLIYSAEKQHVSFVKNENLEKIIEFAKEKWIHLSL